MRSHILSLALVFLLGCATSAGVPQANAHAVTELWATGPGTHGETWRVTLETGGQYVATHIPRLSDSPSQPEVLRGMLSSAQLTAIAAALRDNRFSELPSAIHSGFIEPHGPDFRITAAGGPRTHRVSLLPGGGPLPQLERTRFKHVWDLIRSCIPSAVPELPD